MNLNSLFSRAKPVVSLFHAPSSAPSKAALNLLQSIRDARESGSGGKRQRAFDLEVSEKSPTATQLASLFDFLSASGSASSSSSAGSESAVVGKIVPGAVGRADAVKLADKSVSEVVRPIVVDWGNGKVLVGEEAGDEAKVKELCDGVN